MGGLESPDCLRSHCGITHGHAQVVHSAQASSLLGAGRGYGHGIHGLKVIPGTVSGLVLYAHGLKAGIAPPHGWAWIRAWGALPVAEYGGLRITAPTRAWAHSHAIG
ncbi:hypothetical protein [Bilophila sp.]|uniref:hypothetical protein n=1 Tax=Bilophila sp. TaxID=1929485 RepID=UPI00307778BA